MSFCLLILVKGLDRFMLLTKAISSGLGVAKKQVRPFVCKN